MYGTLIVVFLSITAVILAMVGREARQIIWREIWATALQDWRAIRRFAGRSRH